MGPFATTAPLYALFRPPYPAAFFQTVAEKLGLSKRHALIDLGTGPGLLALGFAPHVGRIVGVDPEPAMLDAARSAAARAGRDLMLIDSTAEVLPHEIGRFDLVTIGRALHWMDRGRMRSLFERLVAPNGAIIVCSARSAADGRNPWLEAYNEARRSWSGTSESKRYRQDFTAVLQSTRFRVAETIMVEGQHDVSVRDLARRLLTLSSFSPEMLGSNVHPMLRDVEQRLSPFSRAGLITETIVSTAVVARSANRDDRA